MCCASVCVWTVISALAATGLFAGLGDGGILIIHSTVAP